MYDFVEKYIDDGQISQSPDGKSYDGKSKGKKPSKFTKYKPGMLMRTSRSWPRIIYGGPHTVMAGQDTHISCSGDKECVLMHNRGYLCKKHRSILKKE